MLLPEDLGQGGYLEGFRARRRAEAKALHLGGAPLAGRRQGVDIGLAAVKVPDTRAPSAPPHYHQPHSCTIAVVSEADLGSSCRTSGPEVSARNSTGGLDVEYWLVRTFPTPSRGGSAARREWHMIASGPRFAAGLSAHRATHSASRT